MPVRTNLRNSFNSIFQKDVKSTKLIKKLWFYVEFKFYAFGDCQDAAMPIISSQLLLFA